MKIINVSALFLPLFLHPISFLVAGMLVGIMLQFSYSPSIALSLSGFMISILLFLYFYLFKQHTWSLIIACTCLGYSLGSLRLHQQINFQKKQITTLCNKKIDCIGKISDIQNSKDRQSKTKLFFTIEQYKNSNTTLWEPFDGLALFYIDIRKNKLSVGDTIQIDSIQLKSSHANQSFNNYLIKEGIIATAFIKKKSYVILKKNKSSLLNWIWNKRKQLLDSIGAKLSQRTLALYSSLFLGNRTEEKKQQEILVQQSKKWGTSHHLARSGLHLVIFIYILTLLLRLIPLPLIAKDITLLILCTLYHIFSWSSISFIRAFSTFLFYKSFSILRLPSHFLHILTLACGIILFFNPIQLFFLDFQLSFGLTFVLAWFNATYLGKN